MKRRIISIALLFASILGINSQELHSYYFLNEWSQRHILNASFAPEYGYFSFTVLGGIELGLNSNSGISNYVYSIDPSNPLYAKYKFTTFLNSSVDGNVFINALPVTVTMNQNMKLNLLSFGFFTKQNSFWSFDIYLKENFDVTLPKDFFRFAKFGMTTQNNVYDLKDFGFDQSNMAQVSLGYSREINSQLRVGLNTKLLIGLSKIKVNYTKLDLNLSDNGYIMNARGESYIMSDFLSLGKDANDYYDFSTIGLKTSNIKPAGIGAAFDFGFTYKPINRLTIAASVNDIGFLKWNATSIKKGVATSSVEFSGFSNINIDSINVQSQLDQLKTNATNLIKFKETIDNQDYKDNIPYTINLSAEYSLFASKKQNISIGMLFQSYNSTFTKKNELIGAVTLKPFSWFGLSGTCDVWSKDFNRYGLAFNFSPKWINLYLASDYITPKLNQQYLPIDKINLNLSFGGSFVFAGSKIKDKVNGKKK